MTDREIYHDLVRGTKCICGATKKRTHSFDAGCYGRLPAGLKEALYATDGTYPDAYRRALTVLGFPEPTSAAPDRGPQPTQPDLFQTHK